MSAWVGDDGRILEPEAPKPSAFFDQDDDDVVDAPIVDDEPGFLGRVGEFFQENPELRWGNEPGSADVPIPATTEAEEWTMMPTHLTVAAGMAVASMADIDRLESKLDMLLERLAGPMPAPVLDVKELLADPRVITDPKVYEALALSPEAAEAAALTPTQDRERAKEIASSARVEAAKAEMEARAAMAAMDPAEAVAQGLGISQPRPGPEDVEDGRSFRDQPAEPDDPFAGLGG